MLNSACLLFFNHNRSLKFEHTIQHSCANESNADGCDPLNTKLKRPSTTSSPSYPANKGVVKNIHTISIDIYVSLFIFTKINNIINHPCLVAEEKHELGELNCSKNNTDGTQQGNMMDKPDLSMHSSVHYTIHERVPR